MPVYNVTFGTWADDAGAGTIAWNNPGNAQTLDGLDADTNPLSATQTHRLIGTAGVGIPTFGATEVLDSISVSVYRFTPPPTDPIVTDAEILLVKGGAVVTTVNKADGTTHWPQTLTLATYSFSAADLAADGIDKTNVTATFGVSLSANYAASGGPFLSHGTAVDQIFVTLFTHLTGGVFAALPPELGIFPHVGQVRG